MVVVSLQLSFLCGEHIAGLVVILQFTGCNAFDVSTPIFSDFIAAMPYVLTASLLNGDGCVIYNSQWSQMVFLEI